MNNNYCKFFLVFCFLMLQHTVFARDIYVAKNGNDSNPGTKDFPYKTIKKAANVAVAGDVVIIREGIYEELLEPSNSGTASSPITFRGAAGEKVIITAMQAVNNWVLDKDLVYKATVNWDLGDDNMAFHKDKLMDLARWPNNEPQNLFVREYLPACDRGNAGGNKTTLNYSKGIPNWDWSNGGSIHFFGGAGFLSWTERITSSSGTQVKFNLNKNEDFINDKHNPGYTGHGIKKGEFFLQGIRQALDYKNEWYYDKSDKTLYVQIENGVKPANNSIRFRRRANTIMLRKNYIHVENLAVFGGSIEMRGNNNRVYQVSSFYGNHTLGDVNGFNSRRQSVLLLGKNNRIEKCEIAWGAGNGVFDQGTDNFVVNNYIHDFNYLGLYDCVLNTRGAKGGKYLNNTLTRAGKDVIQAYVDGGEYAYNDVSWSNFIADDGGLLYTTNVRSAKSSIHHNTFHDAKARKGRFKAAGIYLDNNSKNWDVHHNVVWNTQWTNIQINWNGINLNIFNNTFVKGSATMGAWHKAGTRFENVKVWNNITDKVTNDRVGNQEEEVTWEPQSDKQNNLVDRDSFKDFDNNDYTLKTGAQAVDFGRIINGYTDGFVGMKPDVGAYEYGVPAWKSGVNWNTKNGPLNICYDLPGETCDMCNNPTTWYADEDNDDLGDPNNSIIACSKPSGYVSNSNDECINNSINNCNNFVVIPRKIEAESFTSEKGVKTENTTDVGGGKNVGFIDEGDFLTYKIDVPTAKKYNFEFRVATKKDNGFIEIVNDKDEVLGTINIPNTNGWQNWVNIKLDINLPAGKQELKLVFGGVTNNITNFNYFEINNQVGNNTLSNDQQKILNLKIYPNPVTQHLIIDNVSSPIDLRVVSLSGITLINKRITSGDNKIEVSKLAPGYYFLVDKNVTKTFSFIKK